MKTKLYLVTLTAPGAHQHSMPSGDVCRCTPEGGINLAWWNSTSARRWSDFVTYVRREVGPMQYAKAAEAQRRGAIHFHALVRCSADLVALKRLLRRIAIDVGFGHEFDVEEVQGERAAGYCAKYVSKAVDDRSGCPWLDLETGEVTGARKVRVWTASRQWGVTMREVVVAQRDWARVQAQPAEPAEPAVPLDSSGESSTDAPSGSGP